MKKFDYYFLGVILVIFSVVFLYTLSDFGLPWDSALGELYVGDKNLYFAKTLEKKHLNYSQDTVPIHHDPDHPDFHRTSEFYQNRPMQAWPVGATFSALTKYVFYTKLRVLDPIDAHHISLLFLGLCLITVQYVFARKYIGFYAAIVGTVALILAPRFLAHIHNNIKDVPATVLFTFVIVSFFLGIQKRHLLWLIFAGTLWGLAMSAKANALFLPLILGLWLMYVLAERFFGGEKLLTKPELIGLLLFPGIGIITCFITWPSLLLNFPSSVLDYWEFLVRRGLEGENTWKIRPLLLILYTTPLVTLFFASLGIAFALLKWPTSKNFRALTVLIFVWCFIPVLRVSLPQTLDFDGIRHWMEFLPAFSLLAGMGAQFLFQDVLHMLQQPLRILTALLVFVPVLQWNISNHPSQLAYFNSLIGGLPGAQANHFGEATDYWGSSYRQGISWLNTHAEPDAILYVGVAEHIVDAVRSTWLRKDIQFQSMNTFSKTNSGEHQVRYLMYITRMNWYSPLVQTYDKTLDPIYAIYVEGAPIMKILRISE